MALSRAHIWNPGDLLKSADLNGEFNNILLNPLALISPTTGTINFNLQAHTGLLPVAISATSANNGDVLQNSGGVTVFAPAAVSAVSSVGAGTATLQFNSTVQLQLGLGNIPLKISGVWAQRSILSPITISATSTTGSGALAANTNYYTYAFDNAGATVLEFRTTSGMPHATSTEVGVEIATTDATRTLVGLIRANASTQFSNNSSERFINSWYEKVSLPLNRTLTTNFTSTVVTYTEVTNEIRLSWVQWSSQNAAIGLSATVNNAAGDVAAVSIGFDSSTVVESSLGVTQSAAASLSLGLGLAYVKSGLTEGSHFVTLFSRSGSGGTVTFLSDASSGRFTALSALVV